MNFTQRVGTVSGRDGAMELFDATRATLRTTFRPRLDSRFSRLFFDLRFVAAKVIRRLADAVVSESRIGRAKKIKMQPRITPRLL